MTLEEMAQERLKEVRAALAQFNELKEEERRLMAFLGMGVHKAGHRNGTYAHVRSQFVAAGDAGLTVSELAGGYKSHTPEYARLNSAIAHLRGNGEIVNRDGRWYLAEAAS